MPLSRRSRILSMISLNSTSTVGCYCTNIHRSSRRRWPLRESESSSLSTATHLYPNRVDMTARTSRRLSKKYRLQPACRAATAQSGSRSSTSRTYSTHSSSSPWLIACSMNANAYKMCFWLLAHTLHNRSFLSTLLAEIEPAVTASHIDINYLVDPARCPMLNAAFNETLRYTSAATSARVVLSPTPIGGKVLYPGARVLMPYRPAHISDSAFGPAVESFDPQRFIDNAELAKSPAYRPFGGGSQYCSGRYLARREVVGFLAFALSRFEFSLKEGSMEGFPRMDVNKPNLGIISPVKGDDVVVSIRRRKV